MVFVALYSERKQRKKTVFLWAATAKKSERSSAKGRGGGTLHKQLTLPEGNVDTNTLYECTDLRF